MDLYFWFSLGALSGFFLYAAISRIPALRRAADSDLDGELSPDEVVEFVDSLKDHIEALGEQYHDNPHVARRFAEIGKLVQREG